MLFYFFILFGSQNGSIFFLSWFMAADLDVQTRGADVFTDGAARFRESLADFGRLTPDR